MYRVTHAITYRHPHTGESLDAYHDQYVFLPNPDDHAKFCATAEVLSGCHVVLEPVQDNGTYTPVAKVPVSGARVVAIYEKLKEGGE